MIECDGVCGAWYPGVVDCVGCIRAFFCHDLAPFGAKMGEDSFDCLVGIAKVIFIEFLNVLFFDAVDDTLDSNVGDCLLEIECRLKLLGLCLKAKELALRDEIVDVRMHCRGLDDAISRGDYTASDDGVFRIVKDQG